MWEQLTARYNADRTRNSLERDVDSLKRKFKSLYNKPKPTGQGEVSVRLRPVVWAQETQQKVEVTCGVQTSHDRQDDGEDDEAFERQVNAFLGRPPEDAGSSGAGAAGGEPEEPDAEESVPEATLHGSESDSTAEDNMPTPAAISQCAQSSYATDPSSRATGAVITASGVVDVGIAAEFGLSDDDEPNEDRNSALSTDGAAPKERNNRGA
jgi:hypothetical protein